MAAGKGGFFSPFFSPHARPATVGGMAHNVNWDQEVTSWNFSLSVVPLLSRSQCCSGITLVCLYDTVSQVLRLFSTE